MSAEDEMDRDYWDSMDQWYGSGGNDLLGFLLCCGIVGGVVLVLVAVVAEVLS